MTVAETLAKLKSAKGIEPSATYKGIEEADDFILAIQTESTQTKKSDWIVCADHVREHSGALNASTEDRSRIFRRLFRTQRYQQLQVRLQEENARLNQQCLTQNAQLDSLLAGILHAADDPDAAALDALCAQTAPETALQLLEALLERQQAEQTAAGDALCAAELQLKTV